MVRFPTLTERQAELKASILTKRKNALRLRNNKRARKNWKLRKSRPFREARLVWQKHRAEVEERKAQRLEKKTAKLEAERLREKTRKRKLREPLAESARIFAEAFMAGKRFQAAEDSARFKTQITVV